MLLKNKKLGNVLLFKDGLVGKGGTAGRQVQGHGAAHHLFFRPLSHVGPRGEQYSSPEGMFLYNM